MPTDQYLDNPIIDELEIQGDVLVGLQKTAEVFSFFEIFDFDQFRIDLASLVDEIATVQTARIYEKNVANNGNPGEISLDKMNISFTYNGLKKLGLFTEADDGDPTLDASFKKGQMAVATTLGDDVAKWHPSYKESGKIHGVLIVASWRPKPNDGLVAARAETARFIKFLGQSIRIIHEEPGKIRSGIGAGGIDQQGHEHFGFADGVSQPGVKGLTSPNNPLNPDQGFPGQDLVEPGEFVFGDQYAKEVSEGSSPINATPPRPWMENGSYLVFRRLNQHVFGFQQYIKDHWNGLADTPQQFAARIIGRWPDGSPLVSNPLHSAPAQSEKFPAITNDFDFGPADSAGPPPVVNSDKDQMKCPFSAHIRRMYMRSDARDDASERHRILRAGIAFGDDNDNEKGLLFVCYQTSIVDKFEFIQKLASDATPNEPPPKGLPFAVGMSPPAKPATVGVDLVLARPDAPRKATWATGTTPQAPPFVTATGGGYFFSPSISALSAIAAGT